MKKIAVLMNTDEIGGAERSLVFQLQNQPESEFSFYIPKISNSKKLENFLIESGFNKIKYYSYPASIYSLSRNHIKFGFSIIKDLYNFFFDSSYLAEISQSDMVYINGNKAALLFFAKNRTLNFTGKVVWHLRDYYHTSKLTNGIWELMNNCNENNLSFICNSQSVKKSLESSPFADYPISVIYNPVGDLLSKRETTKNIKTIGFVSMMAPWKGLHEIVLWSKLFESELSNLGITNIKIFGGDIYKTKGEHSDYAEQIKKLTSKFDCKLLSFEGHKSPNEVFENIDCLIHYSLGPEPFGRVILEAFDAGIPVISTCLGGAAELVQSQITGLKVYPHDRHGLYMAVEQLVENKVKTFKLISSGIEKSKIIQKDISLNMKKVLDMEVAS